MLNLKHYDASAADFLNSVVRSKRNSKADPDYRTRIASIAANISPQFTTYDTSFAGDILAQLTPAGFAGPTKKDLLELYAFRSAVFQKLKTTVTTLDLKRLISTCQNCTIGEVNSFDHSVPKDEFPEFSVHPKNLFPSCTVCNGHKSHIWRSRDRRLFLNLYLDQLPEAQYLFVDVVVSKSDVEAKFYVDNRNGVDADLFERISYHYGKLFLCRRFEENIDRAVTPLRNTLTSNLEILTPREVVNVVRGSTEKNRKAFGFNYWKSLLELELLKSREFMGMCEDQATSP